MKDIDVKIMIIHNQVIIVQIILMLLVFIDGIPSDLSGKYGSIDTGSSTTFSLNYSGYDDLMIPLQMLTGKSVGVQCSNTYQIIECAAFYDYAHDAGQSRKDTDSSGGSDSGGSSGSNSDDNIRY